MDISLQIKAYFSICSPGSYRGVKALNRLIKGKATKKQVVDWLADQDAYTLLKPVHRRFPRRKAFARDID